MDGFLESLHVFPAEHRRSPRVRGAVPALHEPPGAGAGRRRRVRAGPPRVRSRERQGVGLMGFGVGYGVGWGVVGVERMKEEQKT